jgi:hypothetical protein
MKGIVVVHMGNYMLKVGDKLYHCLDRILEGEIVEARAWVSDKYTDGYGTVFTTRLPDQEYTEKTYNL